MGVRREFCSRNLVGAVSAKGERAERCASFVFFCAGGTVGLLLACFCVACSMPFAILLALAMIFSVACVSIVIARAIGSSRRACVDEAWGREGGLSVFVDSPDSQYSLLDETGDKCSCAPCPRKASTAHAPRDFNPRQAAVDELARIHMLTSREKEVLEFLARGNNVQFISESLVLSTNTVRTHVYNIFNKLGVHSKQEVLGEVERMCDVCLLACNHSVDETSGAKRDKHVSV